MAQKALKNYGESVQTKLEAAALAAAETPFQIAPSDASFWLKAAKLNELNVVRDVHGMYYVRESQVRFELENHN